jgi:anti-anti-sigma regulatory factor
MELTILPLASDGFIRVRCEGFVSLRGLPPAAEPIRELLGPYCFNHRILLNLERAKGIDTSGVSWLMREHNRFLEGHGALIVCGVPPTVFRLLDILRLTQTLHMASSDAEAQDLASHVAREERRRDEGVAGGTLENRQGRPLDVGRPPQAI